MGKGNDPNCAASMPSADLRGVLTDPSAARDLVLSRDQFRAAVLERDGRRCVQCGRADVKLDAHHVMERRLFSASDPRPGGYVLDNGVTLCDEAHPDGRDSCHMQAELTLLDPLELRQRAGIESVVLPEQLATDNQYTKWGDPISASGRRYRGELFHEEPVQKMLRRSGTLDLYENSYKYPRTVMLPFSPKAESDDTFIDLSCFEGRRVVITEKLDGENTTLSADTCHARSLDSGYHPGRTRVMALWQQIRHEIPAGWRVCGENMQARHSIGYDRLPGPLLVFAIFDERNQALSWDDTVEWAQLLGLATVPVVADETWNERHVRELAADAIPSAYVDHPAEGFVVRVADSYRFADFRRSVAKAVYRHFTPGVDGHWMTQTMTENQFSSR